MGGFTLVPVKKVLKKVGVAKSWKGAPNGEALALVAQASFSDP